MILGSVRSVSGVGLLFEARVLDFLGPEELSCQNQKKGHSRMSITRTIYLLLAIFGLVMTWYYNLQFMDQSGGAFSIAEFIAASSSNAASQSLSSDLAIACIAGLLWIFFESRRLGMRFFWVYIVLTFSVAYAFAFPLFLFIRQGKLETIQQQKD